MVILGTKIHGTMTTSSKKDYLSILGLSSEFDEIELKKAFRREARKWHPDVNKNDLNAEDRFKLINEAYEFLRDPARRIKPNNFNSSNEEIINNFKTGFPEFNDYLNSLFGYEYESELNNESYDDEYSDIYQDEKYDDFLNHKEFNNYDYPATSPEEPPPVKLYQDIETIIELTPDEALNGASVLIELEDQTVVEVDTPPFAGDGWRLRLENIAKGGKDHYLQLKVQTENGLRIDGLRVLYKLELFPPDALLGCAVEVPTLDGNVTLQVPPKSSTGRLLRLKGRGLSFGENIGDQFVEILVVIPADINDEEIALYTRLQELSLSDE
ncbi:DnaJ domain-containing protein [Prochlorococcus sp. AH-716-E13]|nr:DnaJ domain-containing protein [Prochlorococcus sp. AH-716-E13]